MCATSIRIAQLPRRPRCRRSLLLDLTELLRGRRSRPLRDGGSGEPTPLRRLPAAATLASAALLVWLALPTVWWTPLNVDEELTIRVSDFSFVPVFDIRP